MLTQKDRILHSDKGSVLGLNGQVNLCDRLKADLCDSSSVISMTTTLVLRRKLFCEGTYRVPCRTD